MVRNAAVGAGKTLLPPKQRLQLFHVVIPGLPAATFSRKWGTWFLCRHPEVSLRKATAKSVKKLKNLAEKISHWIDLLQQLEKLGYLSNAEGVWNFDESPFKMAEFHEIVFSRTGVRDVTTFAEGSDREQVSVLAGGNATGRMLRPLILYSGICHVASRIIGTQDNCYVKVNTSGVMDCKVWNEYFTKEVFPALTAEKVRSTIAFFMMLNCKRVWQNVIFFDGHYSHSRNKEFRHLVESCGKDIVSVKLPSGMTDLLQPLDVGLFGPLKKSWNDYLRDSRLSVGVQVVN